jgi:hypothetical protein
VTSAKLKQGDSKLRGESAVLTFYIANVITLVASDDLSSPFVFYTDSRALQICSVRVYPFLCLLCYLIDTHHAENVDVTGLDNPQLQRSHLLRVVRNVEFQRRVANLPL